MPVVKLSASRVVSQVGNQGDTKEVDAKDARDVSVIASAIASVQPSS